jgi:tripartite-type tricarboxylate transporter receptor subunit TctC
MQTRRTLLALLCLTAIAAPAMAQGKYPSRPVKIIMSLPAGSSPDVRTRIIAHELGRIWGHQVVVENRPGGGGIISVQACANDVFNALVMHDAEEISTANEGRANA